MKGTETGDVYDLTGEILGDLDQLEDTPTDYVQDVIQSPNHYVLFEDMEAIDAIRELLTTEEYMGYLKGNELKYRFRAGMKDSVEQDIAKAMQYRKMREVVQ